MAEVISLKTVRRRVEATQTRSITSPRSGFSSSSSSKLPSYNLPSWQSPSQNFQQSPVMFLITSILCANSSLSLTSIKGYCIICSPMILFSSIKIQGASLQSTCTQHIDFCCTMLLLKNFQQLSQKRFVTSVLKSILWSVPLILAKVSLLLITQKLQYLQYLAWRIFILVPIFTAPPIITAFFKGVSGIQDQSLIFMDLDSLTRASMQASTLLMGRSKSSWQSSSSPRCTLYRPGKIWNLQGMQLFMSDCCQTSILPNLTIFLCCCTASSQNLAKQWQYQLVESYTSTIQMSSESPSR